MIDRIRSFGARRIAVVVLAAGLVGVVAVPTMLASSATQPAVTADELAFAPDQASGPARLGRIVRGDVTFLKRDGTTSNAHFERGEITAKTAESVTVTGPDKVATTFVVGPNTHIRVDRKAAKIDDLKVGDRVMAAGTKAGSGYDALLIRVRPTRAGNAAP